MKGVVLDLVVTLAISTSGFAQTQSNSTGTALTDRLVQSRAVEAMIWGMPAVNYDLMRQEMFRIGGKDQHQGQERRALRRRQDLSSARAAERAGRAILVRDALRQGDSRPDSQHEARKPLLADPGACEE